MDKIFIIILLLGIVALGIFIFFTFGFSQKPQSSVPQTADSTGKQPTDLKIEDSRKGEGPEVKSGDTIRIHYKGTLTDGTQFDSSYDREEPFETKIGVGQVIEGWDKGVIGMKRGGKRKLTIPPSLGYGDQAAGTIPPNSTLIFEVELVEIR